MATTRPLAARRRQSTAGGVNPDVRHVAFIGPKSSFYNSRDSYDRPAGGQPLAITQRERLSIRQEKGSP
jgi:hypothetical protein